MMKHFKDELNTAVLTTKFVVRNNSPILYVYHFFDGMWQFSGNEIIENDNDYCLLSLEEVITIDNTVLEVAHLEEGFYASRIDKYSPWLILRNEDDKPEDY